MDIIDGESIEDNRGKISFVNDFTFDKVKRFYQIEPKDCEIIRAFHGHLQEEKYVYVVKGKILLCAVKIKIPTPSKTEKVEGFILSDKNPQIIHIPRGYANGFRALEENTTVIFFSTSTLEESKNDDYRFPHDYWGENIWKINESKNGL